MNLTLDNSILKDFAGCRRAGIIHHIHHRQGPQGIYGELGSLFHAILHRHFRGDDPVDIRIAFLEGMSNLPPQSDPALTLNNVWDILSQYMLTHTPEVMPFKFVELEQNITAEIAPGIYFSGKRDALVEMPTGELRPLDHKFRFGNFSPYWKKKFDFSSQFSGYLWLQNQSGKQSNSIWINAIAINRLPDSTRRCKDHGVPYADCRLRHCQFELMQTYRSDDQIAEWARTFVRLAEEFQFMSDRPIADLPADGIFNDHCQFCDLAEWCLKFNAQEDLLEDFTSPYNWTPWGKEA